MTIVKNPEGYMYMTFNGCSAPFSSSLWLARQLLGWVPSVNSALSSATQPLYPIGDTVIHVGPCERVEIGVYTFSPLFTHKAEPTCHFSIQGMTCSSSMCILGSTVAWGKVER